MSEHHLDPTPGFTIIPDWVIETNLNGGDLSVNALVVYMVLCKYASTKTRTSFPSRATIGRYLNKSAVTVDRALAELLEAGLITKEERHRPDGGQWSNLYRVVHAHTSPVSTPPTHTGDTPLLTDETPPYSPVRHELDLEELDPEEPEKRARKARAPRLHRMPEGWRPSSEKLERMAAKYPTLNLEAELEDFATWTTASNKKYADWEAGFESHCRREVKRYAPRRRTDHKGREIDEQGRMVTKHGRFR